MKSIPTSQKLRGAYYTPPPIAQFLSKWAIRSASDKILEPSCGDGVFLEAAVNTLKARNRRAKDIHNQLSAIEFEPGEAALARKRLDKLGVTGKGVVDTGDFFTAFRRNYSKHKYDVVIGNPPFIRFQNFPNEQREIAFSIMRGMGLHPSGLTNAWLPFVCAAAELLNDTGRLAFVIPAELLQVNYAAELRLFLSNYFRRIRIFTFRRLVFNGILQEVVLLCAERGNSGPEGITITEFDGIEDLATHIESAQKSTELKPINHSNEKWTQYFLTRKEILFLRDIQTHPQLSPLNRFASVDVGVVTGLNEFFVVNKETHDKYHLAQVAKKIVSRSGHLQGVLFSNANWEFNCKRGVPSYLLDIPKQKKPSLPAEIRKYIERGEHQGHHTGYKCRIRNPWYCVPTIWAPDAFMLRQIHQYPKIILNRTSATCTDTIHRVRLLNGTSGENLTLAFLTSLTFAFAEIFGRSYGGGVLELEPREAERIPLPNIKTPRIKLEDIHDILLRGNISDVLEQTDREILHKQLGLGRSDIHLLRDIWIKLRERRAGRKMIPHSSLKSTPALTLG